MKNKKNILPIIKKSIKSFRQTMIDDADWLEKNNDKKSAEKIRSLHRKFSGIAK